MDKNFEIITLPLGQLRTNCYLVIDKRTLRALIIDPGDDADYIEHTLAEKNCRPVKIIATHGHFDHIMAVRELQLTHNAPFLMSEKDEFLVKRMRQSAKHFLGVEAGSIPIVDKYLKHKDNITLGDFDLEVLETPGHTPGSICLYWKKRRLLFTGDLLFADGGVGRTDFSYSSGQDLQISLRMIFKLSSSTRILPGHGSFSSICEELSYHKFNMQ